MSVDLARLGWSRHLEEAFDPFKPDGLKPARVAREDRGAYLVLHGGGETVAGVTGRFRHAAVSRSDFPAVGDWVALEIAPHGQGDRIHALLPRKSCLSRRMPGPETQEQIIAANVDTAFIVCGLDGDFSLRRIERYITVGCNSGTFPVVVLNKIDVCADVEGMAAQVRSIAPGMPIFPVSAADKRGLDALEPYLASGQTVALFGSSGVGKSSLINCWIGQDQLEVQPVREHDSRGRHTTTHRELICLPQGGVVIDTPGMRELGLWADDGLVSSFPDIDALAKNCRFRDCLHAREPGCAVNEAIGRGLLPAGRLKNYRTLERESQHMEKRQAQKERITDHPIRKDRPRRKDRLSEDDGC